MDKEEENEFLATVDPENVKVTDKVDTVTVAKADKSTEVNKHRFVNYDAHNTNCNAVKLSVKSLFRYDQDILSSALNERPQPSPGPSNNNPNYKLRVLLLKFFIRKMPSGFSNSSLERRKQ